MQIYINRIYSYVSISFFKWSEPHGHYVSGDESLSFQRNCVSEYCLTCERATSISSANLLRASPQGNKFGAAATEVTARDIS
jgi:hypothetical protein